MASCDCVINESMYCHLATIPFGRGSKSVIQSVREISYPNNELFVAICYDQFSFIVGDQRLERRVCLHKLYLFPEFSKLIISRWEDISD